MSTAETVLLFVLLGGVLILFGCVKFLWRTLDRERNSADQARRDLAWQLHQLFAAYYTLQERTRDLHPGPKAASSKVQGGQGGET